MRFIGAWGVVGSVAATMVVVGGFVLAREPEPLAGTPVRAPVLTVQQLDRSTYREWRALDDSPWAWGIEQEFYDYRPDRSGPHLNVTAGERRTLLTTVPGAPVVVWLVGSSFTYGVGQRDDWTVASAMVRRASADGIPLVVRNFAVPGDTAVMQHLAIEERLEAGEPAPDLVISVEGFNDVTFGVMATALRGSVEVPVLKNAEDALAYNLDPQPLDGPDGAARAGRRVAEGMRSVHTRLARLADEHGFRVQHFFQPDAFRSIVQLQDFARISGLGVREAMESDVAVALDAAAAALAPEVVDLRPLFDDSTEPMFIATVHVNERGAGLTADAVYGAVRPVLDELLRTG